ncbi:MAG TPA: hypothetical protein VEP30_02115 [Chthoniobacterales bacterium]|nr:hypothetical protein [Chthoniobacterales bacterium]
MSLETVNSVAQIIAAIGVIASLFYLAVQIRQNTRSMRAVVVDALTRGIAEILSGQTPETLRSFARVSEDVQSATEEDRLRALPQFFALFKLFENAWFQQRQGTLDREQWQGWDAYIRTYYHRPGVKSWWLMRRATFAPGFRDYLEATEPITEAVSLTDLIRGNR